MLRAAFTAPRFSDRALDNVRQQTIQSIRGSMASPQGRFSRRFQEVFSGGDPRLAPLTEEELQGITLDQVRRVYDSRFSNPEDFALFVVGSVEADEIATLAARYLGGIERATDPDAEPSTDAGFFETIPDSRYPRPEGLVQERVRAGQEPAAQFVMVMHGPYEWSRRANHRLNSVGSLLDIRLREVIREALGGAYSVGAGAFRWRRPEPWAYTQLAFGLDPDRLEELRERALGVVEELRNEVPAQNYLQRIKAQQRQQYQQQLQENGYWLSTLQFYVQHGRDLATIRTFPDLIDSLSAEELQQTAARYLNSDRAIELVLLPAATQE
jgi:zinc protease